MQLSVEQIGFLYILCDAVVSLQIFAASTKLPSLPIVEAVEFLDSRRGP
jgi:hypothetical protein